MYRSEPSALTVLYQHGVSTLTVYFIIYQVFNLDKILCLQFSYTDLQTSRLIRRYFMTSSRFIITVIGSDRVGIVARITTVMASYNVNIVDISQTIMQGIFTMIMLAEAPKENFDLAAFQQAMDAEGKSLGVEVKVQHEDAFRFMHRI
jgi:ACT domain-containing protein